MAPISDLYSPEDELYQQFLAWRQGGGGWGNAWNISGDMGTKSAAGQEAGGGSAAIARGSKQTGGGLGSDLVEQFNSWAKQFGQGQYQSNVSMPKGNPAQSFTNVPPDLNAQMTQVAPGYTDPLGTVLGVQAGINTAGNASGYFGGPSFALGGGNALPGVGTGLAATGMAANLLGAPPAVGFGLGQAGNLVSAIGQGAALGAGLNIGAAGGELLGSSITPAISGTVLPSATATTGTGSAAAGAAGALTGAGVGLFGGLLAAANAYGSYAQMINDIDEARFHATQNQRILGAYSSEFNRNDLAGQLERAVYAKSRLARHEYSNPQVESDITRLAYALHGRGGDVGQAFQRGGAWGGPGYGGGMLQDWMLGQGINPDWTARTITPPSPMQTAAAGPRYGYGGVSPVVENQAVTGPRYGYGGVSPVMENQAVVGPRYGYGGV